MAGRCCAVTEKLWAFGASSRRVCCCSARTCSLVSMRLTSTWIWRRRSDPMASRPCILSALRSGHGAPSGLTPFGAVSTTCCACSRSSRPCWPVMALRPPMWGIRWPRSSRWRPIARQPGCNWVCARTRRCWRCCRVAGAPRLRTWRSAFFRPPRWCARRYLRCRWCCPPCRR